LHRGDAGIFQMIREDEDEEIFVRAEISGEDILETSIQEGDEEEIFLHEGGDIILQETLEGLEDSTQEEVFEVMADFKHHCQSQIGFIRFEILYRRALLPQFFLQTNILGLFS